jgi:hypothetical protein
MVRAWLRFLNWAQDDPPRSPLAEAERLLGEHHDRLVGIFVMTWARMEISLDYANYLFLNIVPGGDQLAESLPRSLDQKIDLFRRAHRELPQMANLKDDAEKLVSRINTLKERRHDIIHGRGNRILQGRRHEYLRIHLKGKAISFLSKNYTRKQLIKLCHEVNNLMGDTALHLGRIRDLFVA